MTEVKHTRLLNISGLVIPEDVPIEQDDEIAVVVESLQPEREYVLQAFRFVDGKGSENRRNKDGDVTEVRWTFKAKAS